MSGGRTGGVRRETACKSIDKHHKPTVQLQLWNVPGTERLLLPNADFCLVWSGFWVQGAEVQAGAASRSASPLARTRSEDDAPEFPGSGAPRFLFYFKRSHQNELISTQCPEPFGSRLKVFIGSS